MASIIQAIDTVLRNDSGIATALGSRIYYIEAGENTTYPYCVYNILPDTDEQLSFGDNSTSRALIQFDIVSNERGNMITARDLIRAKLRNYSGTASSVTILRSLPEGIRSTFNDDTKTFQETISFAIEYRY